MKYSLVKGMRSTDYDSINPYESKQKVCARVRTLFLKNYANMSRLCLGELKKSASILGMCKKIKLILRAHKHVRQQGWPHKNGHTRMAEQNNGFLRLGKDGPNEPRVDRPVFVYSLCHLNLCVPML